MDIRICSDLHLETILSDFSENKKNLIPERTEKNIFSLVYPYEYVNISILAGDIGDPFSQYYWNFITYVSTMSDLVLIVPGNHEYYGTASNPRSIVKTNQFLLQEQTKYSNVIFLIDDILEVEFRPNSSIPGSKIAESSISEDNNIITFIGTTLWSHIPDEYASHLTKVLPVFKMIQEFSGIDGVNIFNEYNKGSQQLLELGCKMKNPFVITHYAPFFNACHNTKYQNGITQYGYSNDLFKLNPSVWCYGHTHYDIDDTHIYSFAGKETIYLSNQYGSHGYTDLQWLKDQFHRRKPSDDEIQSKKTKYTPCFIVNIVIGC